MNSAPETHPDLPPMTSCPPCVAQIAEEGLHRASVEVEKLQFELSIKAGT